MKVLVVDDSSTMRRIIEESIKEFDINNGKKVTSIKQAEDGQKALFILKADPEYDLILTDWNMPKLNGLAFLQKIKRDESLMHIPVIMITSVGTKGEVVAALKSGAKDYIIKPFAKDTLLLKIRAVFEPEDEE